MVIYWLCFSLFLLYFVGYETVWGLTAYKKIMLLIQQGRMAKTALYRQTMLSLWVPAALILTLVLTGRFTMRDIGIRWVVRNENPVFFYICLALAVLYFAYLVYSLIVLGINARKKVSLNQEMPDEVKILLPVTKKEKTLWIMTALTAGITEELIFRGFFFHLMNVLFPGLSIFAVLGIGAVIFGIGHLYQGIAEAVKPMLLGLLFGLFYIAFGTILPCMLLHFLQDMSATYIINEE